MDDGMERGWGGLACCAGRVEWRLGMADATGGGGGRYVGHSGGRWLEHCHSRVRRPTSAPLLASDRFTASGVYAKKDWEGNPRLVISYRMHSHGIAFTGGY